MSAQVTVSNNLLKLKQGVATTVQITVTDGSLFDVHIDTPAGVSDDFNTKTGELTLSSNVLGNHEVLIGIKDEDDFHDVIVLEVEEDEMSGDQQESPLVTEEPTTAELPVEGDTMAPVVDSTAPAEQEAPVQDTTAQPEPEAPVVVVEPVVNSIVEEIPPVIEVPTEQPAAQNMTKEERDFVDFLARLTEYKNVMNTGNMVTIEEGCRQQTKLYKTIILVLNKPNAEFPKYMTALLKFAEDNIDGVFGPKHINRFMAHVKMSKDECLLFTRMLSLLSTTVNVKDLKLVSKRVDFKFIAKYMKNDSAMQKLLHYYNPTSE